jgi:hypothetical protein
MGHVAAAPAAVPCEGLLRRAVRHMRALVLLLVAAQALDAEKDYGALVELLLMIIAIKIAFLISL